MCRLAECDPYEHVDGTLSAISADLNLLASLWKAERGLWVCVMTYRHKVVRVRQHSSAEAAFDAAWRQHNES